jgi:hypothetical protein
MSAGEAMVHAVLYGVLTTMVLGFIIAGLTHLRK